MENLTFYQAVLGDWDVYALYNISTTATDPDHSGIANWWKYQYFGTLNVNPNAFVPWSNDSVTILQAYESVLNPIDFYSGQTPVLSIVSGSGQTGSPGGFVSSPLIVSLTDTNGNPLYEAPVTFTVTSGSGQMQASSSGTAAVALTVLADINGNAQIFFQLPNIQSNTSAITASAGPSAQPAQVLFTETSDTGGTTYPSPFAPSNVIGSMNADGSETIIWQNNDALSPIYIYQLQSSGTWETVATLAAGTTTYTASASMVGSVAIGNNDTPGGSTGNGGGVMEGAEAGAAEEAAGAEEEVVAAATTTEHPDRFPSLRFQSSTTP